MQTENVLLPTKLYSIVDCVRVISGGFKHSMILTDKGDVYSFGSNKYGQCGEMTCKYIKKPEKIAYLSGNKIIDLCCGGYHSIVRSVHSEVYCFGLNKNGQLGIGNRTNAFTPQKVRLLPKNLKIKQISAGDESSAVLSENSIVYVWGWNGNQQFGRYLTKIDLGQMIGFDDSPPPKSIPNSSEDDILCPKQVKIPSVISQSHRPSSARSSFLKVKNISSSSYFLVVAETNQIINLSNINKSSESGVFTFNNFQNIQSVKISRNCAFCILSQNSDNKLTTNTPIMVSPLPVINQTITHLPSRQQSVSLSRKQKKSINQRRSQNWQKKRRSYNTIVLPSNKFNQRQLANSQALNHSKLTRNKKKDGDYFEYLNTSLPNLQREMSNIGTANQKNSRKPHFNKPPQLPPIILQHKIKQRPSSQSDSIVITQSKEEEDEDNDDYYNPKTMNPPHPKNQIQLLNDEIKLNNLRDVDHQNRRMKPISSSQNQIFSRFNKIQKPCKNDLNWTIFSHSGSDGDAQQQQLKDDKAITKGSKTKARLQLQQKIAPKRDLTPIITHQSEQISDNNNNNKGINIKYRLQMGDQTADELLNHLTNEFTRQLQGNHFAKTETTSTSSKQKEMITPEIPPLRKEINQAKYLAGSVLKQVQNYRPFSGNARSAVNDYQHKLAKIYQNKKSTAANLIKKPSFRKHVPSNLQAEIIRRHNRGLQVSSISASFSLEHKSNMIKNSDQPGLNRFKSVNMTKMPSINCNKGVSQQNRAKRIGGGYIPSPVLNRQKL